MQSLASNSHIVSHSETKGNSETINEDNEINTCNIVKYDKFCVLTEKLLVPLKQKISSISEERLLSMNDIDYEIIDNLDKILTSYNGSIFFQENLECFDKEVSIVIYQKVRKII